MAKRKAKLPKAKRVKTKAKPRNGRVEAYIDYETDMFGGCKPVVHYRMKY